MRYDFFFFFFFFWGGGSHGVKGIEVRSLWETWEFRLLLNMLATGYGWSLYTVQSLWGLKEFHCHR